jgi:hypothetical protein
MRPSVAVAAVLLAGVSIPSQAQVAPARFASFTAPAPRRAEMPSQMKWGMIIGGVTGAAVGAIVVSSKPCENQGWACILRPMLVMGAAAGGGLLGMLVGGTIGKSIADHAELDLARHRVGIMLRL